MADFAIQKLLEVLDDVKQQMPDRAYKEGMDALRDLRRDLRCPCTVVVMLAASAVNVDTGNSPRFCVSPAWSYMQFPLYLRLGTIERLKTRIGEKHEVRSLGSWAYDLDAADAAALSTLLETVTFSRRQYVDDVELKVETAPAIVTIF